MTYRLHRIGADDGQRCRTIRLQMLKDSPLAYLETYADVRRHPDSVWQFWARRSASPGNIGVAAVTSGEWIGVMHGYLSAPDTATLVAVWLHPEHRGRSSGVADLMLGAIVDWARTEASAAQLVLLVHEENGRAISFYRRHGFAFTGRSEPCPQDEEQREREMRLPLR